MRQYIDLVSDLQGNALFNASVKVTNFVGGGNAAIFSDNGLSPIVGSTVTTDITGQYSFFAADGDYTLAITVNGSLYKTLTPVSIFDGAAQVTQADTGTANAYATSSSVLEKQLRTGLRSWINIANTNTGASTYAYNGLTTKPIVAFDGSALNAAVLVAGGIYAMEYNGTAWQLTAAFITAGSIGVQLYPPSQAELNAGLTITAANQKYDYYNLLRFGIVPNNSSGSVPANNTAALQALANASITNGPQGRFYFPNTTGTDIYYFGVGPIQLRSGFHLDGQGVQVNFSGAFNTSMNTYGFFTLCFDASIQNLTIVVNYNGTGGVNNGAAIRFGSRSGYGFGTFTTGIFDQDNLAAFSQPLQGGITLRNLRISTNNPQTHVILALGGLRNVIMENLWIDGGGVCPNNGFYYEYGWSSANGQPGTQSAWTSSHMTASHFRNIYITNLLQGGQSQGFGFNGAYDCTVEDIYVNGADQGYGFGTGEAMFYRVWAQDAVSPARQLTLRNLTALNLRTVALGLGGSNPVGSGYLSAVIGALAIPARYQAQTDLLSFGVDGFSLTVPTATGTCVQATGSNVALRNGFCVGGTVQFGAEAINCTLENVSVLNSGGPNGVRFGFPNPIWSPTRAQNFAIRTCKIAGSTGAGIATSVCSSGIIENNQLGYNTTNDVAAEATQTNGVNLAATSFGVKCRGNSITTSGGAVAYNSANSTVNNMNSIENERITQTTGGGGNFDTDFQSASAQVIATAGTITSGSVKTVRLAPAAAVTGVIMPAGQKDGQIAYLVNESIAASTITMAVAGTSRVADGVSCVIAGLTQKALVWDSGTNLWYHS